MKIRTTLIISSMLVILILGMLGIGLAYYEIGQFLKDEAKGTFDMTLETRSDEINLFLGSNDYIIRSMGESIAFADFITSTHAGKDYALKDYVLKRQAALIRLRSFLTADIYEVSLADKNGTILLSTNNESIGKEISGERYFTEGRNMQYASDIMYDSASGRRYMVFSAPIFDYLHGTLLGVAIMHVETKALDRFMINDVGFKPTEEAFLVNRDHYMITPSRLAAEKPLVQKAETENARLCFQHANMSEEKIQAAHENLVMEKDYRGVEVIADHKYIPEMQWCLITKMDLDEFSSPTKALVQYILFFSIALIIITIMIEFFTAKIISAPIMRLSDDVEKITKGNLDIELKKSRLHEINLLTESLNRILASLKLAVLKVGIKKEDIGLGEAIKAKEEAEEKYKVMFDNAVDAIFIADPATRQLVDCNKEAEKLVGYPRDKILSMKADELHPKDLIKETMEGFKKQAEGKIKLVFTEVLAKDNKRIPVSIGSAVVHIGGKDYIQGIFRDISKEKEAEEAMHNRASELERFAKLTVGREERMIELKKRVAELEKKLGERARK